MAEQDPSGNREVINNGNEDKALDFKRAFEEKMATIGCYSTEDYLEAALDSVSRVDRKKFVGKNSHEEYREAISLYINEISRARLGAMTEIMEYVKQVRSENNLLTLSYEESKDFRVKAIMCGGEQIERLDSDNPPLPGDICWVMMEPEVSLNDKKTFTKPRLAVVTEFCSKIHHPKSFESVKDKIEYAQIALIALGTESSRYFERYFGPNVHIFDYDSISNLATDTDVILKDIRTGLPWDAMVQTNVLTSVDFNQLSSPVGQISQEDLDGIHETQYSGEPAVPRARRGLPVRLESDPRWIFNLGSAEDARKFGAKHMSKLLGAYPWNPTSK